MTRLHLTPLHLLLAVAILAAVLAVGAHEVAIHSQPCFWGPVRVPQCQVLR
jgi:hypothetical protein